MNKRANRHRPCAEAALIEASVTEQRIAGRRRCWRVNSGCRQGLRRALIHRGLSVAGVAPHAARIDCRRTPCAGLMYHAARQLAA